MIKSVDAFPNFTGGVRLAVINENGYAAYLVVGAGPGGSPHVRTLQTYDLSEHASRFAFDPAFLGGVYVA